MQIKPQLAFADGIFGRRETKAGNPSVFAHYDDLNPKEMYLD